MALAVSHLLDQMKFELGGGDIPAELDAIGILNQAGHHLYSMHPWNWSKGRAELLDLRGALSGSTATWTAASLTLTETGAFADYTFLSGDEIHVTDGTGATTGVIKIASKTDSDSIVLETSIAAGNLATGDIEWRIDPQTIALPSDLRDIIWIASTNNSAIGGVTLVTLEEILDKRRSSASITASTGLYYAAVVYNGTPPVPILEIYPSPNANIVGAMRIFYRSRWTELTADSVQVNVPDFVNDLLTFIARAYAAGYVRNDSEDVHMRLMKLSMSPIFTAAVRSDGMVQPYHGILKNGGPTMWRVGHRPFLQVTERIPSPTI